MFANAEEFQRKLREAIVQEQLVRDAGFLGVNSRIGRHEVVPLTLYHYVALKVARSPFLPPCSQPADHELCQFLWLLNPEFSPSNSEGKQQFIHECRYFFIPKIPRFVTPRRLEKWKGRARAATEQLVALSQAAREYMDEELQDRPPVSAATSFEADYYSGAASIVGALGREYGWSPEIISHLPLKVVFQLLNEIKDYHSAIHGRTAALFNPSDRIKHELLIQLNQQAGTN